MSSSRRLTIVQVIPSLEAGGAERAAVDVSAAIVGAGHRAIVVSEGGYHEAELRAKRAEFVKRNVASKNPVDIIINAFWLASLIHREKVHVIHARSRAPAWSAYIASSLTGIPFVTTFHAAYKGTGFFKKMYNSVMAKSDRIIAISEFIGHHIKRNYDVSPSRIKVIPRGIDMSVYDADAISDERKQKLKTLWNNTTHAPVIIMPGRLSPIKGHELVIEALAAIKDKSFICVFIGPDQGRSKYSQELRKQVDDYGLADKVRWMDGGDVPAAYALAQLVLCPSQVAEGFGRVPVEAQAMGVPVIATALGATSETVLDGETGWLVPLGSAADITRAIIKCLNMSLEERIIMSQRAKSFVRSKFELKQMCDATLNVYDEVVGQ